MCRIRHRIAFCCCLVVFCVGCDFAKDKSSQKISGKDITVSPKPLAPPTFSHGSGFYEDDLVLTLSHPDADVTIVYTTDGSEPSLTNLEEVRYRYRNQYAENPGQEKGALAFGAYTSTSYAKPIRIEDRHGEPNRLAKISSTWHHRPDYLPSDPVDKATVVRAKAFGGGSESATVTHTYFVSSRGAFDTHLPIASIALNEDALFDYQDGLYVAGKDFDTWRKRNPDAVATGHSPSNYRRGGRETERPAAFQYFVDGEPVVSQNIGVRLHGSFSRSAQLKSFRLYARKAYDTQNKFKYPFFGETNSGKFKRLILRNSGNGVGNEWIGHGGSPTISPSVYFRDAFIQKMSSHLRFDTQDYTPVVTYVNGEYWGMLNLRERYDQHYIERVYGIEEDSLDLLKCAAEVEEGDDTHYRMMVDYISNHDLSREEHYEHVKTLMDVDNYTDYNIVEIYVGNGDWIDNNIRYFRKRTNGYQPDAPYGHDGRWRWMMYDTDHGFGWTGDYQYRREWLQKASDDDNELTIILSRLLKNETFRNAFINRYADLLNTAFQPERLFAIIDDMAGRIADEIPSHRERWNTLLNWETHVEGMHRFAERRPEHARSHIKKRFDLGGMAEVRLTVSDEAGGVIQINTVEISERTPGVGAKPYPWTGIYFEDVPITVTAIPNEGYVFSHWSGESDSDQPVVTLTPTGDIALEAHFVSVDGETPGHDDTDDSTGDDSDGEYDTDTDDDISNDTEEETGEDTDEEYDSDDDISSDTDDDREEDHEEDTDREVYRD